MREYITYKEFADMLGLKEITVKKWAAQKRIPVIRFSPTCVRLYKNDVEKFIEERKIPAITK